ncbi:hypothetical protein CAPTEDRAFT_218839 [Capitella teleta]|uniref:protein xylosyltransferase n=1 Tax=Capitella teleta TaxID=283909 RepID=R7TKC1_CAPTE|nr:hypothetical protein CAPTEDRAFT_218839 [Capitella teleta]|eukprot:ELT93932.1 hypothetical protein CAPTEDRAFT_218839 [Capitella teleta]
MAEHSEKPDEIIWEEMKTKLIEAHLNVRLSYYQDTPIGSSISANYSVPEHDPWTSIECPKNYFIAAISYTFNQTAILGRWRPIFLWTKETSTNLSIEEALVRLKNDRTMDLPASTRDEEMLMRMIEQSMKRGEPEEEENEDQKWNMENVGNIGRRQESKKQDKKEDKEEEGSPQGQFLDYRPSKIASRDHFLSPSKPRQDWEDVLKSARDNYERRQRNQSLDIQVAESDFGPCPTLLMCLGYQACVFHLSTEFCRGDPVPLFRKQLDMNVVCEQDAAFPTEQAPHGAEKLYEEVVYLKYDSKLEIPLRQYESTQIHPVINKESEIFDLKCPDVSHANQLGYRGNCSVTSKDSETISKELWFKLAKMNCSKCREHAMQTYCSYQFNSQGECIPPWAQYYDESEAHNRWSEATLPEPEPHPEFINHEKLIQDEDAAVIPARLGFLVLMHQSAPAVVQLLDSIYSPLNHYVVHIDNRKDEVREEMKELLGYLNADNIHIIPQEQSFTTSWGSYWILRAILQGMKHLMKVGIWDHAMVISGSDLPVRSVKDMMHSLAPYRGHSFFALYPDDVAKFEDEGGPSANRLWFSCDGFTHSLGNRNKSQHLDTEIYGMSTWAAFAREFVDAILNGSRPSTFDKLQWFMQTTFIPEEGYFSTLARSDPYFKTRTHHWSIFTSKGYYGENIDGLCRHTLHADSCGQGPSVIHSDDIQRIQDHAHQTFFSRKYSMDTEDVARKRVLRQTANDEYGHYVQDHLPEALVNKFVAATFDALSSKYDREFQMLDIRDLRPLPRLLDSDSCCYMLRRANFHKLHEFYYFVELLVADPSSNTFTARSLQAPKQPLRHRCFDIGDIRMIYLSTSPADRPIHLAANSLPFDSPSDGISVQIVLTPPNIHRPCSGVETHLTPALLSNQTVNNDTWLVLSVDVKIYNPREDLACQRRNYTIRHPIAKLDRPSKEYFISNLQVQCIIRQEGYWTVSLSETDKEDAFLYNVTLLVAKPRKSHSEANFFPTDSFSQHWSVESVAILDGAKENAFYNGGEMTDLDSLFKAVGSQRDIDAYHENNATHSDQPPIKQELVSACPNLIWPTLFGIIMLDVFQPELVSLLRTLKNRVFNKAKIRFYFLFVMCALVLQIVLDSLPSQYDI